MSVILLKDPPDAGKKPPKLLDQLRQVLRTRHYSYLTEKTYVHWVYRYVMFHGKRHPAGMGAVEIRNYLSHLAMEGNVAASTQNQALCAIIFLYKHVLKIDVGDLGELVWAKKPATLPTVLTMDEVQRLLSRMEGTCRLIAELMYGSGMRVMEALSVRVQDLQFERGYLIVRRGKGDKDRRTLLPEHLVAPLKAHLERVHEQHGKDLEAGYGTVYLPYALAKKYPTMIYTHVAKTGFMGVTSPGDLVRRLRPADGKAVLTPPVPPSKPESDPVLSVPPMAPLPKPASPALPDRAPARPFLRRALNKLHLAAAFLAALFVTKWK